MSNIITIRSVYGKVNQSYFINPCPNPRTGKFPDCVKMVDSKEDMILSEKDKSALSEGTVHFIGMNETIVVTDGTTFNLDDIVDNAKWEAIKYCNWIAKDRSERDSSGNLIIDGGAKRYGSADLYVERVGEIAKVKVSKRQLVNRAENYVFEDSESNRIKKCKVLGRDLSRAVPSDVLDFLLDKAEKDPKKIIDLYEDEGWKMVLVVKDAVDRGIIRKTDGLYKYSEIILGASEEAVALLLKDIRYKKVSDSIKLELYPELQPKAMQAELESKLTEGIPYFEESPKEEIPVKKTTRK